MKKAQLEDNVSLALIIIDAFTKDAEKNINQLNEDMESMESDDPYWWVYTNQQQIRSEKSLIRILGYIKDALERKDGKGE